MQRVLGLLQDGPLSKAQISARLGHKSISGQLNKIIRGLVGQGAIVCTISNKPNSRLQRYRIATIPAGSGQGRALGSEGLTWT
ncbi:MAG: ATP-dependent DNA helicase [Elusimicrobiota bacterium]